MATHFSILAWIIPRTEEPGGLQSMVSQSRTRLSTHVYGALNTFNGIYDNSFTPLHLLNAYCVSGSLLRRKRQEMWVSPCRGSCQISSGTATPKQIQAGKLLR